MKEDTTSIVQNIRDGVFHLIQHPGKSKIWNVFAQIQQSDNIVLQGYLCCRKCLHLHSFDGKRTSNLNRHRCYKLYLKSLGKSSSSSQITVKTKLSTNVPKSNVNASSSSNRMRIEKLDRFLNGDDDDGTADMDKASDEDVTAYVKEDATGDMEYPVEDFSEEVKVSNPLEINSQSAEEEQESLNEPSTYKRKRKLSVDCATTKVKQRNVKQLNSLCEMIKADLLDAPDDLFFVAKWRIMDVLRDVQGKRLEMQEKRLLNPKTERKRSSDATYIPTYL